MSSTSRCVARLASLRVGEESVSVEKIWSLPRDIFAEDANAKAEGLLIDAVMANFIAVDTKSPLANNVFRVQEF